MFPKIYEENHKTLMKGIKQELNNWRHSLYGYWQTDLKICKERHRIAKTILMEKIKEKDWHYPMSSLIKI